MPAGTFIVETDFVTHLQSGGTTERSAAAAILERDAEIARLRAALAAIQKATIDGRVCDDVAWFDAITTLHDFCADALEQK
jgi:hypothetical protein